MNKKEFATAKLDSEHEIYVVHVRSVSSVALFSFFPLNVHHKPQIVGLIAEEAPIKVPNEYVNFTFSPDLIFKLPKCTGINDHTIELVNANGPIRLSESPAGAPILFDQKSDGPLRLYVWGFNNLTIKNRFASRYKISRSSLDLLTLTGGLSKSLTG